MARKRKPAKLNLSKDLWVAPRMNLKGPDGDRAFSSGGNLEPDSGARFLELADIALGLNKPAPRKRKP